MKHNIYHIVPNKKLGAGWTLVNTKCEQLINHLMISKSDILWQALNKFMQVGDKLVSYTQNGNLQFTIEKKENYAYNIFDDLKR